MRFSTDIVKDQYRRGRVVTLGKRSEVITVDYALKDVILALETLARAAGGEITVTDLIEPRHAGTFSLHPFGYAADIRTRDWKPGFYAAAKLMLECFKAVNPAYQHLFEDDAPGGAHLHLQHRLPDLTERFKKLHDTGTAWYQIEE